MLQQTDQKSESRRCIDGFEIIRGLGKGGMGVVHLAYDRALDRRVALKFSAPAESMPFAQERLIREAQAVGRISHPNVVSLYGTGTVDGRPYIVYEFVEGINLDTMSRPMPWQQVVQIGIGLSRALAAIHRHNVLHRDVKPSNVMLDSSGQIKLIDFGLATIIGADAETGPSPLELQPGSAPAHRLTDPGVVWGTPLFLAPERWQGAPADRRSDIYSFGLLLYEQLVAKVWLADLSISELATFVCSRELQPISDRVPNLPSALATLIDRCICRDVYERPQSMTEVRDELEHIAATVRGRPSASVQSSLGAPRYASHAAIPWRPEAAFMTRSHP